VFEITVEQDGGPISMDLASFDLLLTPDGQKALALACERAPTEDTFLACSARLEKQFPTPLTRASLETALLRRRATVKFSRASEMYFTREALEQASGEAISRYQAERFAGTTRVADCCCSIGGDTISLAEGRDVTAIDLDPLRLAMARENLAAYGLGQRVTFLQGDLTQLPLPEVEAIFFDPARRLGGARRLAAHNYQPPLNTINRWLPRVPALGVKLAPGISRADLAGHDAETEFISVRGELKECVLWFGPLRTTATRATLLPDRHTLVALGPLPPPSQGPPLGWLYDPDPAILRAGLVTVLAEQLGARQLDPEIAYLTSDSFRQTPFADCFRIEEALPFQLKRLRERLRVRGVGRLTVKRRGSPLDPDDLVRRLKLSGTESRVLFLTRVEGKPHALIGLSVGVDGEKER
jgi:THUMP domain-like/RNA cap guanine-N2 methyltransferase